MSIGYQSVQVSPATLLELKQEMDSAQGEKKYYRFKGWLHYANLDRWQRQGHHFHYLTDCSDGGKKLLCTCGLFIEEPLEDEVSISQRIKSKLSDFNLDLVQMARGHRSLDDFSSSTAALIFNFIWDSKIGDYLWSSYCQICGEVLVEKSNDVAKAFTQSHNASCLEKL
jgi:hypothetical protein